MNSWDTPIYSSVKAYVKSKPIPFHMPGHKMGRAIPEEFLRDMASIDVTEIPGTDNLHNPQGPIMKAQQFASSAFGADKTYFLVNGSTCGIHSAIMTICKAGDKLIIARDCHKSVFNGISLAGAVPVYVVPKVEREFGICDVITPGQIDQALKDNPDAVGVFLTRPTYYGLCCDIKGIADIVHSHGKILAVDEAHGAHLRFSRRLPVCAMDAGADICVQSAHKTLPALTQSAYLHIKGRRVDTERLSYFLSMLQTSSPSYIMMASLDMARACMQKDGDRLLEKILGYAGELERKVSDIDGLKMLWKNENGLNQQDKTRIVINVRDTGKTGFEVERILRKEFGIQAEMSDFNNVVMISTIADRYEDFVELGNGLQHLVNKSVKNSIAQNINDITEVFNGLLDFIPNTDLDCSGAINSSGTFISLDKASGRTSKVLITPYPPGIPLVCPGEIITKDIIEHIYSIKYAGGTVMGISENMEVNVVE